MIKHPMEGLVRDVVLSVIGDEAEHLTLESDFAVLDVDQLAITYIVLALESRLGIELPTHLEDARTVAELVAGARDALRANAATKGRLWEKAQRLFISACQVLGSGGVAVTTGRADSDLGGKVAAPEPKKRGSWRRCVIQADNN